MLLGGGSVSKNQKTNIVPILAMESNGVVRPTVADNGLCMTLASDTKSCKDLDEDGFDDESFVKSGVNDGDVATVFDEYPSANYSLSYNKKLGLYSFRALRNIAGTLSFQVSVSDANAKAGQVDISVSEAQTQCVGFLNAGESFGSACSKLDNGIDSYECSKANSCEDIFTSSFAAPQGSLSSIRAYKAVSNVSGGLTLSRILSDFFLKTDSKNSDYLGVKPLSRMLIARKVHSANDSSPLTLHFLKKSFTKSIRVLSPSESSSSDIQLDNEIAPLSY